MSQFCLIPCNGDTIHSRGLQEVIAREAGNPCLETYHIYSQGAPEWGEGVFLGDRDIAGIAWGSDPTWVEGVASMQQACQGDFGA